MLDKATAIKATEEGTVKVRLGGTGGPSNIAPTDTKKIRKP
jgi:hypothetical protein